MKNWKRCTLSDIGEIVGGATPSTKTTDNYSGDIPWITPKDLSNFHGRFIFRGERNITKKGLSSCSAKLLPLHSILFSSRAPIGYVAISATELCTNQGFKSIIPNEDIDFLFLYYLLIYNCASIETMSSGTTFKEVSGSVMKKVEVFIPTEKDEQHKIAMVLGALDGLIENITKINQNLQEMANALFKSWFINFDPFGGVIPNNWNNYKFSSFLTSRTEKGNNPEIQLFSVTDSGIFPRSEKFKKNLSKETTLNKIAYQTDLIFGMSRKILNWGIMMAKIGYVSSVYNVYAVDNLINTKYLESYIKFRPSYFNNLIRPATREGQGVDKVALFNKTLYLPPKEVLDKYYALENPLTEKIKINKAKSDLLIKIRDSLLSRLISGELRISDSNK
jgi:type I restriction enzyme S subunit